jgi:predicted component of type VI protein secretion system
MAKLYWLQPDNTIVEFAVNGENTIIGRGGRSDIRIKHPGISTEHVLIQLRDNVATLEDMRSTNGTRVNGRRVDKHALRHGDQIEIGRERLMYFAELDNASRFAQPQPEAPFSAPGASGEVVSTKAEAEPHRVVSPAAAALTPSAAPSVQKLVAADSRAATEPKFTASVVMLSGALLGKRFELDKPVTTLGKEGKQVIEIQRTEPGKWRLVQREGATPPYVNGDAAHEPLALKSGDLIEMVGVRLRFEMAMSAVAA